MITTLGGVTLYDINELSTEAGRKALIECEAFLYDDYDEIDERYVIDLIECNEYKFYPDGTFANIQYRYFGNIRETVLVQFGDALTIAREWGDIDESGMWRESK